MEELKDYCNKLERALLTVDRQAAGQIITSAINSSSAIEVVGNLVTMTLKQIGDAWETGRLALSQVYMSGIICEELIDKILPPQSAMRISQPKMAIGVFEDYHVLGKRIVQSTLRASGYEMTDLGAGLTSEKVIELIDREKIKILLLSVLMLPSALHIKELKRKLNGRNVKLIVGGAPFRFDPELYKEVGADAFGKDSSDAILVVSKIMEEIK
jgi:methanogenic corrinoid protein MtbC1